MSSGKPAPTKRYVFVDALRGIAALWVVVFHGYSKNLVPMTGYALPQPFDAVFRTGYLGVYVFFVISGFVIMESIRGADITPRFVGRFALRRSLRLDPPYWATIVAMIVLSAISGRLQKDHAPLPLPTVPQVIAHVFYLQKFLGYEQIVGVFWTLCYEVQFYLLLTISMGFVRRYSGTTARAAVFVPLWVGSALCIAGVVSPSVAWCFYGWPFFFFGVALCWANHGELSRTSLLMVAIATAALGPWAAPKVITTLVTGAAIYAVATAGKLATLSLGRVFQYLGRISYSTYLVHMLVGTPLVRFGLRHTGPMTFGHAILLMIGLVASTIIAAHIMYVVVERPAVRWSHRLVQLRAA